MGAEEPETGIASNWPWMAFTHFLALSVSFLSSVWKRPRETMMPISAPC